MPPYSRSKSIMRKQVDKYQASIWLHIPAESALRIYGRNNVTPTIFNKLNKTYEQ